MKVSELISRLQQILATEGDLQCFDGLGYGGPRLSIVVEGEDRTSPPDWNMPDKYLSIGEDE